MLNQGPSVLVTSNNEASEEGKCDHSAFLRYPPKSSGQVNQDHHTQG